jgi:uncharacterized protein (UPF0218 family)
MRLQKLSTMAPRINAIIYGLPGVGKTRLCCSADAVPQMRKVLLLDVDGGALSAQDLYPNVERLTVTKWQQVMDVHAELANTTNHGFQTVILDTGTEAQKYDQASVMKQAAKIAADKGEVRDEAVPSFREWGITQDHFRQMVRGFRDLPMNFLMNLHVKDQQNELTGKVSKSPDLPGKLARQIAGFFDVVLYMYVKEVPDPTGTAEKPKPPIEKRLLLSSASELIIAKDRSDKLPAITQDMSMKFIYNTIYAGAKK